MVLKTKNNSKQDTTCILKTAKCIQTLLIQKPRTYTKLYYSEIWTFVNQDDISGNATVQFKRVQLY